MNSFIPKRVCGLRQTTGLAMGIVAAVLALLLFPSLTRAAAPEIQIVSGPAEGSAAKGPVVRFGLSATHIAAEEIDFYCSVNGGIFYPCRYDAVPTCLPAEPTKETCSQVKELNLFDERTYTFRAFASTCSVNCDNENWWIDGPVTTRSFWIDRTPPAVTIVSGPSVKSPLLYRGGTFSYTVSEPATMTCMIDKLDLASCASPIALDPISNGRHHMQLIATDPAGNTSLPFFTYYQFDVDIFKPKKCKKGKTTSSKRKFRQCLRANKIAKRKWKRRNGIR